MTEEEKMKMDEDTENTVTDTLETDGGFDEEYDFDDVRYYPIVNPGLYNTRCDTIENAIEELGLERSLDENGKEYGHRGNYYLKDPMIITVDNTEACTVKIELLLFNREWEDEDFDFDHFYGIVAEKCFPSLARTNDGYIRYGMKVPEVLQEELFPEVVRASIRSNLDTLEYFRRLRRSYRDLFC